MPSLRLGLALMTLLGLAVRLLAAYANRDYPVIGDALTYHAEGGFLADGEGFRRLFEDVPTAEHPPGHIVLLAGFDLLGVDSVSGQKYLLGVVGTATVLVTGLLGRRVGGERVGVIAAGLAAVYPMLWLPDAALMSETTSTLLLVAVGLAAFRLADRPGVGSAALLGALIALGALARGEAIALGILLAAPLLWRGGEGRMGRRAVLGSACLVAAVLVLAPWAIRNATTFERPVLLSTNGDSVFAGANCESTYFGELVGSWDFRCFGGPVTGDEAQAALQYRDRGFTYASEHRGQIPVVVAARLGRMLDVYRPWGQGGFFASQEGRQVRFHRAGLVMYWLLIPFGVAGVVLLRRRRRGVELLVLLAPFVLVVLVGAAVYGNTRFRTSAEPSLVILAAVGLEAALAALLARRSSSRTVAA